VGYEVKADVKAKVGEVEASTTAELSAHYGKSS